MSAPRRYQLSRDGELWASFDDRQEALEYASLLVNTMIAKKNFDVRLTDSQDGSEIYAAARDGVYHEFHQSHAT